MGLFSMSWPYWELRDGVLYDEEGMPGDRDWPLFKTTEEAEGYLMENDIRGNVVG